MTETKFNYDEDVDILYISFSSGEKATTAVELNDNILLRYNRAERRPIGLTLMDFSVLVQWGELGPRNFALSGLADLEPERREEVIGLITHPPVNQILKLATYTGIDQQITPIVRVENPLVPA